MNGDDLIRNIVENAITPSTHIRNLIARDGTPMRVELAGDAFQPDEYIQLIRDNHWYKWDQEAGAYRWFSSSTPPEIAKQQTEKANFFLWAVLIGIGALIAVVVSVLISM
jgi:hypothetical protein